jgi:predicted O-methyltransferase YrrM
VEERVVIRILEALGLSSGSALQIRSVKRGGWLGTTLPERLRPAPRKREIEAAARATNELGPQKLAAEYGEPDATRTPDLVRSSSQSGDLYAYLVQQRRPSHVIEFGAAFGVSGMYFVAALDAVWHGHLYTFELTREWADIAERNIRSISDCFTLTRGAFEDYVDVVPPPIDLALVDGIHTYACVMRQFAILKPRMAPGGIIVFDDIDFKKRGARMREAWEEVAAHPDVVGAVEVRGRLGLAELT